MDENQFVDYYLYKYIWKIITSFQKKNLIDLNMDWLFEMILKKISSLKKI